jgi:hypothetical protein
MVFDDDDDRRAGVDLPWDPRSGDRVKPPTDAIHQEILRRGRQWRTNRYTLFEELRDEYPRLKIEHVNYVVWRHQLTHLL